jgi:RNA polymerase sigma-70 factor, ECF subfamily
MSWEMLPQSVREHKSNLSLDGTERALTLPLLRGKQSIVVPEQPNTEAASALLSDEALLDQIRNHDKLAALTLFRRYDRLVLSIGFRILQDEGEAEDLAQEIFLRLFSEAGTFDELKGSARTWFIQMIYRRAFDRRAYLNRRQFYVGTEAQDCTNTVNGVKNPEDDMINCLTARQLKTVFSELSDRQRETLEAFFFEGLKFAEIAERCGEDVTNVRHHYYRGLERLRQLVHQMMHTRKFDR